jgi:hypothetical protein
MFKSYIMVTHWDGHWDSIPKNETHYHKKRIKFDPKAENLIERAPTLFIKLDKNTKKAEKAWIGCVCNIRKEDPIVRFNVFVEREVPLSEIPERYRGFKEGWYLIDWIWIDWSEWWFWNRWLGNLYPPFFASLGRTENWEEFENGVFLLLKLIGLHNLHRFERQEQRGRSDGFFVFKNLVVIYDCTLEKDFEKSKAQQIENYVSQLKSDRISWRDKKYTIRDHEKQVWIITRGTPRVIEQRDDIKVKEVPVQELIKIYGERLKEDVDEEGLVRKLLDIAEQ